MNDKAAKIGYSYWGFLGDKKYDGCYKRISTPDGNAFYSWSIIYKLLDADCEVLQVMPDRDKPGYELHGEDLFKAWCQSGRSTAYEGMTKLSDDAYDLMSFDSPYESYDTAKCVKGLWDKNGLCDCNFVLHEWRMLIPGRNDAETEKNDHEKWQPDFWLQDLLIEYCIENEVIMLIFDLDYKLTVDVANSLKDKGLKFGIIELGDKWSSYESFHSIQVEIPFCFDNINEFNVNSSPETDVVYVGNRYERDWCVDKYFADLDSTPKFYGNWLEAGRDSAEKWKDTNIEFCKRLHAEEMHDAYSDSICTVLMAKRDYCTHGFMTARLIESVFYGTVPLFIEEFGEETIKKYCGIYSQFLTVSSAEDIDYRVNFFKRYRLTRRLMIEQLREHLSFMDVKNFVINAFELLADIESDDTVEVDNAPAFDDASVQANVVVHTSNVNEAFDTWYEKLSSMFEQGFSASSRDGDVAGEVLNAITVIDDPTRCFCTSEVRNMPARYAIGELAWYLTADNSLSGIQLYTSNWDRMSDDGETVNSNYGYCIKKKFGFDQWESTVKLLKSDMSSRQAVIHIKEPRHYCNKTKDVNCTVCLQFLVRDGKLYMTTYMRSNDLWYGFPYDVFQFTFMQVMMAMELGLELGTYTHIAGSLHLYKRNVKGVND